MTELTAHQLTYLLTLTGENTGMSAIRPSSFTAMDVLALREKLKEMRDGREAA
jgi:hypothetical protein